MKGRSAPEEFSFHNFESLIFYAVPPVVIIQKHASSLQTKKFGLEDVEFKVYCALNMICQGATVIKGSSAARSHR